LYRRVADHLFLLVLNEHVQQGTATKAVHAINYR
jgi:hypothetical protein